MNFTNCQKQALEKIKNHKNIFLTGMAGTGKSYLIRHVIKGLDRKTFPVLASTGAAAVIIGGRTFHSFFGLGILEGGKAAAIDKALQDKKLKSRLNKIEGFVLDEVSMIPAEALEAAETICRLVRNNEEPWGGVRVIAVGDFAQLPPINAFSRSKPWAFLSPTWQETNFKNIVLKTIIRTEDKEFIDVLNHIRVGHTNDETNYFLNQKTESFIDDYNGTCLFPRRKQTNLFNQKKLAELDHELYRVPTKYQGPKPQIEQLKKQAPIPETLEIKLGAFVMIRVNDPGFKYINGTTGHIIDINKEDQNISLELKNGRVIELSPTTFALLDAEGEVIASATNYPLSLAYALTIHKAQGTTLDEALIDLRSLWEPGQAYVALSRLSNSQGLKLMGWDKKSILADDKVTQFYDSLN